MTKKLIIVLLALAVCCTSAMAWKNGNRDSVKAVQDATFNKLGKNETLCWEHSKDYLTHFYSKDEKGNKTEVYVTPVEISQIQKGKDGKSAWYLTYDKYLKAYVGLTHIDGAAGTVTYICDVQYTYCLSKDEKYALVQDSLTADPWKNMGKDFPFTIDVIDTSTGKKVAQIDWVVYNSGNELRMYQTSDPNVIGLTYKPEGIEWAEAEIHLDTMTLHVIRDDTHLPYEQLPDKYKKNVHA